MPCLKHALDLLNDVKADVQKDHVRIQSNDAGINLGLKNSNDHHHNHENRHGHHHHHHKHDIDNSSILYTLRVP